MILPPLTFFFFFFNDTATTEIYTLSLHDALPISNTQLKYGYTGLPVWYQERAYQMPPARSTHARNVVAAEQDRKSTRLNSSHDQISYAVFCLKKKKTTTTTKHTKPSIPIPHSRRV